MEEALHDVINSMQARFTLFTAENGLVKSLHSLAIVEGLERSKIKLKPRSVDEARAVSFHNIISLQTRVS
jgi:hypothetical protein